MEGLHLVELVVGSVKVMGKMCKRLVGGRLEEKTVSLSLSSGRNGQSTGGETYADTDTDNETETKHRW